MPIFKINKTNNYTVMSNFHLKDKNMSLKAKGMLSLMLSLPDNWDYSVEGLVSICMESKSSIQNILKELEGNKYLIRIRTKNEKGQFNYEYNIYEKPHIDLPCMEKPCTDNQPQLNTNILNTNKQKKNISKDILKEKKYYGELQNVKLTDNEYSKLKELGLLHYIDTLSFYIKSKGDKYKDHYATIRTWDRKDKLKMGEQKKQVKVTDIYTEA